LTPVRPANHQGSSTMTMKEDLADRENDIHWPKRFNPSQADLFSHNALLIKASCERIWNTSSTRRSGRSGIPTQRALRCAGFQAAAN
jgi:hypothetical protein